MYIKAYLAVKQSLRQNELVNVHYKTMKTMFQQLTNELPLPLKSSRASLSGSVVLQDRNHDLVGDPQGGLLRPQGGAVCGVGKSIGRWLSPGGGGGGTDVVAVVGVEGLLLLRSARALLTRLTELGAHLAQVPRGAKATTFHRTGRWRRAREMA